MVMRELAGPQLSPFGQSLLLRHTVCAWLHMRIGPGEPLVASTQVSVVLVGGTQVLAPGLTHVLGFGVQTLFNGSQVFSLELMLSHFECGSVHGLGGPTHELVQ
jgi:hypothetical protein